jgi:hypothetical protein
MKTYLDSKGSAEEPDNIQEFNYTSGPALF